MGGIARLDDRYLPVRPQKHALVLRVGRFVLAPALERQDGCARAGHDAAQQHQRAPPAHPAPMLLQRLTAAHDLGAEAVDSLEERTVDRREGIGRVLWLTGREDIGVVPLVAEVGPSALDEVTRQSRSLLLGETVDFPGTEALIEQPQELAERGPDPAVRRGGEQNEVPLCVACQLADELIAQMALPPAAGGHAVGLVDDDQIGPVDEELVAIPLELDPVDAEHLDGEVLVHAPAGWRLALERAQRLGTDDDGVEAELLAQLPLPLVAEVGRAEDGQATDLPALPEFAGDEPSFDRLAHPDVVGDEQPHRVEPESHQERHELVGARADGDPAETAERGSSLAEEQASRLPEEAHAARRADLVG
ncbi:hypothetical protein HRbin26_02362 [bacterium HR26]|nr:hypothetical protein HRbin26_02362 [bacterium HR26]